MKKRIILLLIIMLTVGFASVSVNLILNGTTTVAFDNNKLKVVFQRVSLNNEESENVIIDENGKSFVYIADDLTSIGDIANIEYDIKNQSSIYDARVIVSCTTDYEENIEYTGNTLNQIIDLAADEGYTDTLTTKLTNVNTSSNSLALKCSLIVNPESRETIMLGREYNVSFDSNGGSTIDSSVIVKYYEKYGELPVPIKPFNDFLGWYMEDGEKIDASSIVKIKDSHILIAKWKKTLYLLINDVNKNGRTDIGDEIQVGTENFYVISKNDTELNALAKYNLNVGNNINIDVPEGIQNEKMVGNNWQDGKKYGTLRFSKTNGWPNNTTIDIKQYDGPVKDALYGENGYERYIQEIIKEAKVRLITKGEIENLINNGNKLLAKEQIEEKANAKGYSWVCSTTYWTENASSTSLSEVWGVYSRENNGQHISYMDDDHYGSSDYYGVRPVITIPIGNISTVTFDSNGGTAIDKSIEVMYGYTYGKLPVSTKEEYEFEGWFTDSGEKIDSSSLVKIKGNHTLIAKWEKMLYNLPDGCELINDINKNGRADIGDEIRVGTESFYAISRRATILKALAKHNLNVGYNINTNAPIGIQNEKMVGYNWQEGKIYGTVAFSNNNGWDNTNNATIDIKQYDGPVKDALYGENGYEKYIQQTISNSNVRLITKGEIETLINEGNSLSYFTNIETKAKEKGYSWLYSTTYWTQSSFDKDNKVWGVYSHGSGGNFSYMSADSYGSSGWYGVRPVITIPLS